METALEVLSRAATMVNAASGKFLNAEFSFCLNFYREQTVSSYVSIQDHLMVELHFDSCTYFDAKRIWNWLFYRSVPPINSSLLNHQQVYRWRSFEKWSRKKKVSKKRSALKKKYFQKAQRKSWNGCTVLIKLKKSASEMSFLKKKLHPRSTERCFLLSQWYSLLLVYIYPLAFSTVEFEFHNDTQ